MCIVFVNTQDFCSEKKQLRLYNDMKINCFVKTNEKKSKN